MKKFIVPLAMVVTEEQYLNDLHKPLMELGYEYDSWYGLPNTSQPYLLTSFADIPNEVGANQDDDNNYLIEPYNPELFLKLASLVEGDELKRDEIFEKNEKR